MRARNRDISFSDILLEEKLYKENILISCKTFYTKLQLV